MIGHGPGVRTWLEVRWTHGEGWRGLSVEDGWVKLENCPIECLVRTTG